MFSYSKYDYFMCVCINFCAKCCMIVNHFFYIFHSAVCFEYLVCCIVQIPFSISCTWFPVTLHPASTFSEFTHSVLDPYSFIKY